MSAESLRSGTDEQKSALVERILCGEITPEEACRRHGLSDAELTEWVGAYRRITRRAIEEQLNAALSARGLPAVEESPTSELSGSLEGLALAELLQTLEHSRKDAQIRIEHDGEQSQIWCEHGEIVDARSGALAGAGALYRLLSLGDGRFYAHFARAERARTIHASTPALLLEAAKRHDECQKLRERIGDTSRVYVVSPSAWDAQVQLEPETWQLLRAFDGITSLERVVSASTLPELETLTAIGSLLDQGLIMPQLPPSSPRWLPLSVPPGSPAPRSASTERSPLTERSAERSGSTERSSIARRSSSMPSSSSAERSSFFQRSFSPLATSLRAGFAQPALRRRLWLSAAAGAAAVGGAFAIGFWSVRHEARNAAPRPVAPQPAAASARDWAATPAGSCPAVMARIPGGPLLAQSAALLAPSVERAAVAPFCLARHEVTVAEYEACVAARGCEPAEREYALRRAGLKDEGTAGGKQPPGPVQQCNSGQPGRERHPINCVSFQQAERFCAWRGGRLPNQSEWEHAASQVTPDPDEAHQGTLPVGSFPAGATPEGVLDLFGNVSEWTTGRVGMRTSSGEDDPRQLYAVLGGGLQPGASRVGAGASRLYMNANARGRTVGFRCAFDLR